MTDSRQSTSCETADYVKGNQMPIKQIACLAGYSSTSRFIARFKERFGLTPGALRKVMLPDNASE